MKTQLIRLLVVLTVLFTTTGLSFGDNYTIGVLAKNGPVKALGMWKATGDYLSQSISGHTFEVVPLGFDAVNPSIESGKVDFFLVNSSMFVTAKVKYGASAIATMVNSRQGQPLKSFGGVILTTTDNDAINTMSDLKGKTFMAVKQSSFGGWQMAFKEILDAGINPQNDFAKLEFGGKHDNVVYAVMNGVVDAGTVRTDTLERLEAAGEIDLEEFKIVNPQRHAGFPFVCSTTLYPEWPLAKSEHTPDALAVQVVDALKKLKAADKAAKSAKIVGWVNALDYGPIENLQSALRIGAYAAAK